MTDKTYRIEYQAFGEEAWQLYHSVPLEEGRKKLNKLRVEEFNIIVLHKRKFRLVETKKKDKVLDD